MEPYVASRLTVPPGLLPNPASTQPPLAEGDNLLATGSSSTAMRGRHLSLVLSDTGPAPGPVRRAAVHRPGDPIPTLGKESRKSGGAPGPAPHRLLP